MTETQRMLVVGLYINSALYLVGVFVAAILTAHPLAWRNALVAAGVSYFAYLAQIAGAPRSINAALVVLSIALGCLAGILLLV